MKYRSDPFAFNPSEGKAWVATIDPPLFLGFFNDSMAEGGQ